MRAHQKSPKRGERLIRRGRRAFEAIYIRLPVRRELDERKSTLVARDQEPAERSGLCQRGNGSRVGWTLKDMYPCRPYPRVDILGVHYPGPR